MLIQYLICLLYTSFFERIGFWGFGDFLGLKEMTTTAVDRLSTLHVAVYRTVQRKGRVNSSPAEEKWPQVWQFQLINR